MPKKILIIDDEPDQIKVLKKCLEAAGYEFIPAINGTQGIEKALQEKPDLLLTDVLMPDMDGFEVCRRFKQTPQTKNIPIIILTAIGIKDLEDKARACGADMAVRKPYEAKELLALIKTLIKE